jgi:hypothetical protein
MIVRRRGDDMRAQPHWRPSTAVVTAPTYADTKFEPEPDDHREDAAGGLVLEERRDAPRRSRMAIAIAALVLVAVIAGQQRARSAPVANALPATPRAWVDSWMAASVDNPDHVCKQLLSPALAAAFRLGGRSKSGYLTIVLSRIRSGWQAVDIVPGPTSHR